MPDIINGTDIGDAPAFSTVPIAQIDRDSVITGDVGFGIDKLDSYTFLAPASGLTTFMLSGLSEDLDLILYDEQIVALAFSFESGTDPETIEFDLVAGNLYYIDIAPFELMASAYTLQINFASTAGEALEGSAGDDTLTGSSADDTFTGRAGNDRLDGGAGDDVAIYFGNASGYQFGEADAYLTVSDRDGLDGDDGSDRLARIENLQFADRTYTVTQSEQPGVPLLLGSAGDESFDLGGAGVLHVDGRGGRDTAVFAGDSLDYQFSLSDGIVSVVDANPDDGDDGRDDLTSFETLRFADQDLVVTGGEFRVNTTTVNDQILPEVAALTDGGYVIGWASATPDGSNYGVYGQRYSASGVRLGDEFRVNTGTVAFQAFPAVVGTADGGFVVTWTLLDGVTGASDIHARRYDSSGVTRGEEFVVNEATIGFELLSSVAALPDGGFVVSWSSSGDETSGFDVRARRFDADGIAQGSEVQVNSSDVGDALAASVATLADGGYVIAWLSVGPDTVPGSYYQRYDASGNADGAEIAVRTTSDPISLIFQHDPENLGDIVFLATQYGPNAVSLSNGGFVVNSNWLDASQGDFFSTLHVFDAMGLATSDGRLVSVNGAFNTSLTVLSQDDIVLVWPDTGEDGTLDVFFRRFDASATPLGPQTLVNTTTNSIQALGVAEALAGGGYVVAWSSSEQDQSSSGVFAQQYEEDGDVVRVEIRGTDGDDVLFYIGSDAMRAQGFGGNDIYIVERPNDVIIERPDEGIDTVRASLSWTLDANLENLALAGDAAIDGAGNELDNLLVGNSAGNSLRGESGADTLIGGKGADTMRGGTGADIYYVDNIGDQVIESDQVELLGQRLLGPVLRLGEEFDEDFAGQDIAGDIDEVISTITYTLTDFVENLTLTGLQDIDGAGNSLDNVLIGNGGDNVLTTNAGDYDRLSGNGGSDTFVIDKRLGKTLVRDLADGADTLDLVGFLGTDSISDVTVGAAGDSLVFENSGGGIVAVYGFYSTSGPTIRFVDFGAGPTDVSSAADSASLAALLGTTNIGSIAESVDDDGNLWDSTLVTSDGGEVSAAQAQLFRSYAGALGRDPDDAGYQWWLNEIAQGRHDLRSMAAGFIFSEEFTGFFDAPDGNSIDNSEFVTHMYVNVFGREPDEGGFAFWLGELESGNRSQVDVLVDMTQSNEYVELTVFTAVDYLLIF